jgi:hypothetical protein
VKSALAQRRKRVLCRPCSGRSFDDSTRRDLQPGHPEVPIFFRSHIADRMRRENLDCSDRFAVPEQKDVGAEGGECMLDAELIPLQGEGYGSDSQATLPIRFRSTTAVFQLQWEMRPQLGREVKLG